MTPLIRECLDAIDLVNLPQTNENTVYNIMVVRERGKQADIVSMLEKEKECVGVCMNSAQYKNQMSNTELYLN